MRTIWKYPVPWNKDSVIRMPAGAKVRHVALQGGDDPRIWVEVDTDNPMENRYFTYFGTGEEQNRKMSYIGTVLIYKDTFVWHLYEYIPEED